MVCMSSALSLPAIRNLACCQAKRARSRAVKYLRAARPRANQNSDAPIIIVLSTSKNAAADASGTTAGGGAGHLCPGLLAGAPVRRGPAAAEGQDRHGRPPRLGGRHGSTAPPAATL